jgi:hypothetical protein
MIVYDECSDSDMAFWPLSQQILRYIDFYTQQDAVKEDGPTVKSVSWLQIPEWLIAVSETTLWSCHLAKSFVSLDQWTV